jgi:hypothetical protein
MCVPSPRGLSGAAHRWPPSLHSGRPIRQRRRLMFASDGHDAARGQQLRTGGRPPSERGACLVVTTNQRPRRSTTIRRALKVRSHPLRSAVIAARSAAAIVAPSAMHRCAASCVRAARRCDAPPSVWRVARRFATPLAAARAADLRGSSANGARRRLQRSCLQPAPAPAPRQRRRRRVAAAHPHAQAPSTWALRAWCSPQTSTSRPRALQPAARRNPSCDTLRRWARPHQSGCQHYRCRTHLPRSVDRSARVRSAHSTLSLR